jgi:photosystem II stability/assembly factor-like uncharacterized protein
MLSACAPVEYQSISTDNSDASVIPAYPLSTSYLGPVLASTPVPSGVSAQQSTLAPSSLPTLSPTASPADQVIANTRIAQFKMVNGNIGWAIYSAWAPYVLPLSGVVLRTVDGAQTWMDVTPPISENKSNIRVASFMDADTAVVISDRSFLPTSSTVDVIPWRTTNAGQTWQKGETIPIYAVDFYPLQLDFIDPEHGWLLCESNSGMNNMRLHLFETRDGGIHWDIVYDSIDHISDTDTLWIKGYYPYSEHITFASETAGFFSDGMLFGSQDGGKSWVFRPLSPPADLLDIDCQGGNCEYLATVSSPQFTSAQDGVLIRRVYSNSDLVLDVFIYYPNTLNRLPLPIAQYLYYTDDSGQTWAPKASPVMIGTVCFIDPDTGWLLGKNDPDPAAPTQLYQTTNAGEIWNQISSVSPLPLGSELQFVDEHTGFAFYPWSATDFYKDFDNRVVEASQNSYLYSTNDGGRSWIKIDPRLSP